MGCTTDTTNTETSCTDRGMAMALEAETDMMMTLAGEMDMMTTTQITTYEIDALVDVQTSLFADMDSVNVPLGIQEVGEDAARTGPEKPIQDLTTLIH